MVQAPTLLNSKKFKNKRADYGIIGTSAQIAVWFDTDVALSSIIIKNSSGNNLQGFSTQMFQDIKCNNRKNLSTLPHRIIFHTKGHLKDLTEMHG